MAKTNPIKKAGNKTTPSGTNQDKGECILSLISSGLKDINELADTFNKVSSTIEQRKTTYVNNIATLNETETNAQKEKYRHDEEMARITREWKKIMNESAERERKQSFIKGQIERFSAEYDKYIAMETDEFLSDTVTKRLDSLRKVIIDLTKELNKA